ncbi:MAG: 5-formyltetrahydrofolate cyclo-ligase [Lysobacter sp.]|nr:5-formyltetrahydrofolate cyclo-ligase [Lysobacter sp.]
MTADRNALRSGLRQLRRAIPAAQRIAAAEAVADRLLCLLFAPVEGYVAGYWALDGEIALHAWQLRLPPSVIYCLPVLHEDDRLRFAPWRPGDALVSNRYGIPEPDVASTSLLDADAMQLVAVPTVGFDAQCHRLGMGGGWYDRSFAFLQSRPAPPWLAGVAFSAQRIDALSAQPWDVRLDAICTESESFLADTQPA